MKEDIKFYSKIGEVVCYSPDGEHIFLWSGKPVGYFYSDKVFSFSGRILGWFDNGWLFDQNNYPSLFSEDATGGPTRPTRKTRPTKSTRQTRPTKSVRQTVATKPSRSTSWSEFSDESYFYQ